MYFKMNIDNVALIIPTYPQHYTYIYNLLDKLKSNNITIDIYLVFSNTAEYDLFTMKTEINQLILPESTITHSIVTFKKFFGLKHLSTTDKYDYFICCDSESDIIPETFTRDNINNKIKSIFENKKIYSGHTKCWVNDVNSECAKLFPNDYENLRVKMQDFHLFSWWSDVPVYRRSDLLHFFDLINYDNITRYHFDYLIYQNYLILYHEFEIINITPLTGISFSLEELNLRANDTGVLNTLIDIQYSFSWVTKSTFSMIPEFIKQQGGFMIYHLDRS